MQNLTGFFIYIDTDPKSDPVSGTGTTDGETWRWDPTLPFSANYHYAFKTLDLSEYKRKYDSGNWTDASFSTSNWKGSQYWEVSINLNDIGNPSQVYILAYVEEDWFPGYICGGCPQNLFTNTAISGSIIFNDHWLGFNLDDNVIPNNSENFDQSLPIELASFFVTSGNNQAVLNWSTASEVENLGFIIMRSLEKDFNYQEIVSYKTNNNLFGAGNSSCSKEYSYTDVTVENGTTYWYKLVDVSYNGKRTEHGPRFVTPSASTIDLLPLQGDIPVSFSLDQNYPNPFNPLTKLKFNIPKTDNCAIEFKLNIYNVLGRRVKTLLSGILGPGTYEVEWNGRNDYGQMVPSGIYIYQFESAQFQSAKKMVFVR